MGQNLSFVIARPWFKTSSPNFAFWQKKNYGTKHDIEGLSRWPPGGVLHSLGDWFLVPVFVKHRSPCCKRVFSGLRRRGLGWGLEPLPLAHDLRNKRVRMRQNIPIGLIFWGGAQWWGGFPFPPPHPLGACGTSTPNSKILGTPMGVFRGALRLTTPLEVKKNVLIFNVKIYAKIWTYFKMYTWNVGYPWAPPFSDF